MNNALFKQRLNQFADKGELTAFNLATVMEGLQIVQDLHSQNTGTEVIEQREGEYKSWDPEILKVDIECENQYRRRLEERGSPVVMLSEEAGRVDINENSAGEKLFCVCDPFDGSYLFKRGIPDFWYSSLSFYGVDFSPKSCVVGDCTHHTLAFANQEGAFIGSLQENTLANEFKLDPTYRDQMGRSEVTDMEEASIESYGMKPQKYLIPLVSQYEDLLRPFKFYLPNGGPYGFVDVAEGKIDVYFAVQQPFVDVFSGIYIAEQAGLMVTDFEGESVRFTDDPETMHNVVVSTNSTLHNKVLEQLSSQ
ncbi:MAG TPA: inositol monophosphatase family protein [bacterium]|nr:inositol monophosphatase family protein [bacterium]